MANEIRTLLAKSFKTKAPSGLTITRNGNSFVCQWKKSDKDYDGGQQFQYKIGSGAWTTASIGAKTANKRAERETEKEITVWHCRNCAEHGCGCCGAGDIRFNVVGEGDWALKAAEKAK
jgi:hypothetical protein